MDSWTLQGDSYSFKHSAPRTFSLRHRDGTPNHVEIFDITNLPSHRGAISETTCLCDIFGDDCESPSLSSSPASGAFIPPRRGLGDRVAAAAAAASLLEQKRDDLAGSCRSVEVKEEFMDSVEGKEFEKQALGSEHLGQIRDSIATKEPKRLLTAPGEGDAASLPDVSTHIGSVRTPSPGLTSPCTPITDGRGSSLSSSSVHSRSTLSSTQRGETYSSPEPLSVTTNSADRYSSPSHQPSPSPEPRNRASSCSSAGTLSSPESRGDQLSPEPRNITNNTQKSPSPEAKASTFEPPPREVSPNTLLPSQSPTLNGISSQSRESSLSPGPRNRTYSSDTLGSSPFPELRGRVSLPDLFSRASTPEDSEDSPPPEGFLPPTSAAGGTLTPTPEGRQGRRSATTSSTVSTPAPRYTPPPPVASLAPTPDHRESSVTPEDRGATPSTSQLRAASPTHVGTPSPTLSQVRYAPPRTQRAPSPAGSYASGQSPGSGFASPSVEARTTAPSPDIRITASSPAGEPPNTVTTPNSLGIWSGSSSANPRSLASSPHISGISYSILQPEDMDSASSQEPTPHLLFPTSDPPCHPSPETTTPPTAIRDTSASTESFETPTGSPRIASFSCADTKASPEPGYHTPLSEPGYQTPSPRPLRRWPASPTASPQHRYTHPSPDPSPPRQATPTASSPKPQCQPEYKKPCSTTPSPHSSPIRSPLLENKNPSPTTFSAKPEHKQHSPTAASPQPDYKQPSPAVISPQPESNQPSLTAFSPQPEHNQPSLTALSPQPEYNQPSPTTFSMQAEYNQPEYTQPQLTALSPHPESKPQSPTAFSQQPEYNQPSPTAFSTQPEYNPHSPIAFSPQPEYNQPEYKQPFSSSPLTKSENDHPFPQPSKTPEVEAGHFSPDMAGELCSSGYSAGHSLTASPAKRNTAASPPLADSNNYSPGLKSPIQTPEPRNYPCTPDIEKIDSSAEQHSAHRDIPFDPTFPVFNTSITSPTEDVKWVSPLVPQREEALYSYSPQSIDFEAPLSDPPVSLKGRHPVTSPSLKSPASSPEGLNTEPVHRSQLKTLASPHTPPNPKSPAYSPVSQQRRDDRQPRPPPFLTSDSRDSGHPTKSQSATEHLGKQPITPKTSNVTIVSVAEGKAHHVSRRRSPPSPPLTRFTPVHIIPPEKPQRQWQNRGHSPSRPKAKESPPVAKRPAKQPGGSPRVASHDGNSQPYWVRLEKEMERQREREREWEEEKRERERERERQREGERQREERAPGKGEGRQEKASNREEQVELSFSARNRKGPVSRSTAPTSKETHQGMPSVHSYSESLLGARPLQPQQHSLLRAQSSQKENRGAGGSSQKFQSTLPQTRRVAPGRVAAEGPVPKSSMNMGSELDDSDDEVKWFSDLAFRSLSSPEVDYLDMYNSSHRSSTNASQPSTQDSPAGANAAWLAYADLRGSAPRLDGDDFQHQQPPYYSDGLDPSKHYEMGSFECVDVAIEREEIRKVRRGVPKRQIQLKRKDTIEQETVELKNSGSDGSSPLVPVLVDSPSIQRRSKETFLRQNSTPAAMQDSSQPHASPEPLGKPERKSRLQKSVSLDETCPKTKMASCLIKSVLSKKMQNVSKQSEQQVGDEVSPTPDDTTPHPDRVVSPLKESPGTGKHNLSSSLPSDYSLSSDHLAVRREPGPNIEVRQQKSFGVKPSNRASPRTPNTNVLAPQADTERSIFQKQRQSPGHQEMRSELVMPFDSKKPTRESVSPKLRGKQVDDGKEKQDGREGSDSANAAAGNTGAPPATKAGSTRARMSNSDMECESLNIGGRAQKQQQHQQQQQDNVKSTFMSKTPEINLKTNPSAERKKSSLNVSLTPELENAAESMREADSPEKMPRDQNEEEGRESALEVQTEDEEMSGNSKTKAPMHKVRDVRKLVKNKYNLSFKATSASQQQDTEEIREEKYKDKMEDTRETKREQIKEARRDEQRVVRREEKREVRREEKREVRREEQKVEIKESKFLTFSPSLQRKGKPLSRSQPMQIECKAVSWRENKDKTTPMDTEAERLQTKAQLTPPLPVANERNHERSHCSREPVTQSACQASAKVTSMDTGRQTGEVKPRDVTETEKPELAGRDRKPPMLGSIPKVPSKDREVSSTVVVLTDGSSKAKSALSAKPLDEKSQSPSSTLAQAPSTSHPPGLASPMNPGSSSHSVSTLVREKGYQADIGSVMADGQGEAGGRGAPYKHINRLEIPLQTCGPTDGGRTASQRERTFSSSSVSASASSSHVQPANPETSGSPTVSDNPAETVRKTPPKNKEEERVSVKAFANNINQNAGPTLKSPQNQTKFQGNEQQVKKSLGDIETAKKQEPFITPRSPALRRFKPQPIEVKSVSKETQKQEMPSNRPRPIEVRSISNVSQKPVVPPKPNYKFNPADLGSQVNETPNPAELTTLIEKEHSEVRPPASNTQKAAVSSPGPHRRLSNGPSTPPSNYRKLAVSAVSSYRPPQSKATSISSLSHRSTAASTEAEGNKEPPQQQNQGLPPTSGNQQRPTTLAPLPSENSTSTSAPAPAPVQAPVSAPAPIPPPATAFNTTSQSGQPADLNSPLQYPRTTYPLEHTVPLPSNNTKQPPFTAQAPGYAHPRQPYHRSLSSERSHQREDELRFYALDDAPPSYDDRESFSPLLLPDPNSRKPNRYHPTSFSSSSTTTTNRPPPCSCTSGCPSYPGLPPPGQHHHHSPHNLTPPAPSHSPGHCLPYPSVSQPPPLRSHQCRPDPQQPMSYPPGSPKSSQQSPGQAPAMYHHQQPPLPHQGPLCPPHPSAMQPCPGDRPVQPPQHMDPRRPPTHRSPQQHQPPPVGVGGGPYGDHGHSHSPNLPPLDPQYLCGPQSLGPPYGSEYGGDSSSLYSDGGGGLGYGQTPRRVLMDPETGKYFYIEVPLQPLRKMLFDPETGQYVEVLIPQQTMSHTGLYPPSAAPYPSLHNPNMYAPAPQYMPYTAPPPHTQAQPHGPHHPEAPAPGTMLQNGAGMSYRDPPGPQAPKPEPQSHPALDHSYLESMYYDPTGMNASPNLTPPDCYHKHPPSLPNAGGKRS